MTREQRVSATGLTKRDGVDAALSIAEDLTAGRLDPAQLEAELMAEMSRLIDTDAEPGSELAALQARVARRALVAGLLPVAEVAEWAAVARSRSPEGRFHLPSPFRPSAGLLAASDDPL